MVLALNIVWLKDDVLDDELVVFSLEMYEDAKLFYKSIGKVLLRWFATRIELLKLLLNK